MTNEERAAEKYMYAELDLMMSDSHRSTFNHVQDQRRKAYIAGLEDAQQQPSEKCLECNGEGGFQYQTEHGIGAERCPNCGGTGKQPTQDVEANTDLISCESILSKVVKSIEYWDKTDPSRGYGSGLDKARMMIIEERDGIGYALKLPQPPKDKKG